MELDSDDDYERVELPSDSESEPGPQATPLRNTSPTGPLTPVTNAGTPYCREKRLKCPYQGCDKAFNRPVRLEEHLRSHTNERPFKCPYPLCDKDYLRESHLKHHIKSAHTDVRDYKCSHGGCGKSFATGQRLNVHEATHDAPNKYTCREYAPCNQVFRKKETLQRHILMNHESQAPYPCRQIDTRSGKPCTKSFDTQYKLSQHERQMHDPSRFSCNECMNFNAVLKLDPSIDENERVARCKPAYFATYAEYQAHNAQEHPPTCPRCSLSFSTPKELTRHSELVHGIVNPNVSAASRVTCHHPGCGKTFSKKGNLNVHVRTTHENRRDFICGGTELVLNEIPEGTAVPGCGRDFVNKASLIDHVRSVHLGFESQDRKKRRLREEMEGPKSKKSRKDKGIRKTSAIVGRTTTVERYPFTEADSDMPDWQSELDDDDGHELDGNTTMVGSMLFEPRGAYRYSSGLRTPIEHDSNSDRDPFPIFSTVSAPDITDADSEIPESFAYPPSHFENELDLNPRFPSAFTLEPEMSNALDPMLFLSTPSRSHYRHPSSVK